MNYIGIDCGGTHMRVGIVDENGVVLGDEYGKSPLKFDSDQFGAIVKISVEKIASEKQINLSEIKAIGVGTPGPIDFETGSILKSANLANTQPIHIKEQLKQAFQLPISIDRDTIVALRGEVWKGGAVGLKHVVMLTLGTGVGGAILVNGEIDEGSQGKAGEIGHMFLQVPDLIDASENNLAPHCGLGHKGCLEAFIKSTTELDKISYYLGYGLANMVDIFNPEKILIGGGMSKHGDFLPKAIEIMKEKGMSPAVNEVQVEYTKLGELSGVVGSAKLAIDAMQSSE